MSEQYPVERTAGIHVQGLDSVVLRREAGWHVQGGVRPDAGE